MISFSQNCEDVLLQRAFAEQAVGTWVDVGASHPVDDSVTKALSLRGWSGINIEPLEHMHQLLVADRERDINLRLAVSHAPGQLDYFRGLGGHSGLSTLDPDVAAKHRAAGYPFDVVSLPVLTLDAVLREHTTSRVDVLKVDVEGHELSVLRGAALSEHAPRVLVIEATEPASPRQNHHEWEPLVLAAGYVLTLFDGLNRFYVHRDCPELVAPLSVPANVFDGFVPYRFLAEKQHLEQLAQSSAAQAEQTARAAAANATDLQSRARAIADTAADILLDRSAWPATYQLDTVARRRVLVAPHRSDVGLDEALRALSAASPIETTVVVWLPQKGHAGRDWEAEFGRALEVCEGADLDLLVVQETDDDVTAGRLAAAVTHVLAPHEPLAAYAVLVPGAVVATLSDLAGLAVPPQPSPHAAPALLTSLR